jgi:LysM repeat protein
MIRTVQRRAAASTKSVLLIAVFLFGLPTLLVVVARFRFGGAGPVHGVPSPARWKLDVIKDVLTERLTNEVMADIVIRCALVVGWLAFVMLLVTVAAEFTHMLRHDGIPMPNVRGIGFEQRIARVIATGLLALAPFASATRAVAGGVALEPVREPITIEVAPVNTAIKSPEKATRQAVLGRDAAVTDLQYVVQAGDSVYGIAAVHAGPDGDAIANYAEQIIELNLGTEMSDGYLFSNAAFIDVGWVLQMPGPPAVATDPSVVPDVSQTHVVESGETLWSIAGDELGDPKRWPDLFDANVDRVFGDGRRLSDADVIQPGWELQLTTDRSAEHVQNAIPTVPGAIADESSEVDRPVAEPDVDHPSMAVSDPVLDPAIAEVVGPAADAVQSWEPLEVGPPLPANSWNRSDTATRASHMAPVGVPEPGAVDSASSPKLVTIERAGMLASGVIALVAVRRRRRLRSLGPAARVLRAGAHTQAIERRLRALDSAVGPTGESTTALAVRSAARYLIAAGAWPVAILVGGDGTVELIASGVVSLESPWSGEAERWTTTVSELRNQGEADVEFGHLGCPAMVQVGHDDVGREVYIDLEALGALEVGGAKSTADAIVSAIASTLASSPTAETATLIGIGVDDAAFLEHRFHVRAEHEGDALELARDVLGATPDSRTTFDRRSANCADACPHVSILVGSRAGTFTLPADLTGLAVVSASPIYGPSSRLSPDGDTWLLMPANVRFSPIGLAPKDLSALAELTTTITTDFACDDETVHCDRAQFDGASAPTIPVAETAILVRLLGPVSVGAAEGDEVSFERTKSKELLAWLATHRDRSTRGAARTALWEIDVRDATFANVVSEARRSLGRLVAPPTGEEWVGRTLTDALPLHEGVVTDVDLLERAIDVSAGQPAPDAIETLTPAVELIRGIPFEGTSYLWPDSEGITSRLVLIATTAASSLAQHCLAVGDVEGVFSATGRGLRVLPGHEDLIGLRMKAHAQSGDRAGVRQEWLSYERAITADCWSDGEPSPKLVALRSELLKV